MRRDEIPDDRSPFARAAGWAASAMTVAAEMVLPVLLGAWLDRRLSTKVLFTIIGGSIGIAVGIWSLIRMVRPLRSGSSGSSHQRPDQK